MGSLGKGVGALEEYIESRVEERMREEIEAMLDVLEEQLTREEFIKMVRIVAEAGDNDA